MFPVPERIACVVFFNECLVLFQNVFINLETNMLIGKLKCCSFGVYIMFPFLCSFKLLPADCKPRQGCSSSHCLFFQCGKPGELPKQLRLPQSCWWQSIFTWWGRVVMGMEGIHQTWGYRSV